MEHPVVGKTVPSRPGIKTAILTAAVFVGAVIIIYWPQIKATFNIG